MSPNVSGVLCCMLLTALFAPKEKWLAVMFLMVGDVAFAFYFIAVFCAMGLVSVGWLCNGGGGVFLIDIRIYLFPVISSLFICSVYIRLCVIRYLIMRMLIAMLIFYQDI